MGRAARAGPARLAALALLTCSLWPARADNTNQEYYTALINVTVQEPGRGAPLTFRIDRGRYGLDSPKAEVRGQVLAPLPIHGVADHLGCDPQTRFFVPPNIKQWIALLQRGNCTFKEKISRAAFHNAVAVVIYNNKSKEEPVTMTHPGTGDIIAVMITELRGKDILSYLEKNISVQMTIAVGTRMPPKNFSRGSLVFVSISFIVLMIISSAWLIFYFIQKIRYTHARDRNQRRLGDAAKKAISKLTTRTVKKGDKETDPDFDHCAVCIESYKQNDVVRILPCNETPGRPPDMVEPNGIKVKNFDISDFQGSCMAPRGCRAVRTTHLQCRPATPAGVLITIWVVRGGGVRREDAVFQYSRFASFSVPHVFHKSCVDPWLSEHCTCPMCKLNILKALGIVPNLPCTDNSAFDMERLTRTQALNRRSALGDLASDNSLGLEPLRTSGISPLPQDGELTPRTGEINIAVTKEWFIIASFGLLSALTLCYMIIRATASLNTNE
ncbi:hypothetical protein MC885_005646 [Smutsia gigantea]|nr:hypothetical protein MC885_005646 [Smutsia gigantea]